MRSIWLVSLVALLAGCASPHAPHEDAADAHHATTYEEAKALAAERNVPVLIDFYSPT